MKKAMMISTGRGRGSQALANAYPEAQMKQLRLKLDLAEACTSEEDFRVRAEAGEFRGLAFLFSTWGMISLTEEEIQAWLPELEAVFYAAGTVQMFARPFLNRGVRIFSAFRANAVPVAQYTLAQIILAGKGYFQASRLYTLERRHDDAGAFSRANTGNYGQKVGLLGAGAIGRLVIGLLHPFGYEIQVFDPFLSDADAVALGVKKASLEEIFSRCDIISNHLANNDETQGMLNAAHFKRMKPYTTFINTGRGAQVVEADLISALEEDPSRTALLDVTWPEPVSQDSPFHDLPNVFLTPHIAGSQSLEIARMGQYMLDALEAYETGQASEHEVVLRQLETMA